MFDLLAVPQSQLELRNKKRIIKNNIIKNQRIALARASFQEEYDCSTSLMYNIVFFVEKPERTSIEKIEKFYNLFFGEIPEIYLFDIFDETTGKIVYQKDVPKKTGRASWLGWTVYVLKKDAKKAKNPILDAIIVLPFVYKQDIRIFNIILYHELAELLHLQHGYCQTEAHKKALIFERMFAKEHFGSLWRATRRRGELFREYFVDIVNDRSVNL